MASRFLNTFYTLYTNSNKIEILYVEDDDALAFVTMDNLSKKGYQITHCKDGLEAIKSFQSKQFDLCILDIMLPQIDGITVAQIIRNTNQNIPIIFLSAKSSIQDKLEALSKGGDDYLYKPFSINELIMRIQVFLRRSKEDSNLAESSNEIIRIADFEFNPIKREISHNKNTIVLSNAESKLMHLLAMNQNKIVYKDDIRARFELNNKFSAKSLNTNISKLRKVFASSTNIAIENVRDIGFRLRVGAFQSAENE